MIGAIAGDIVGSPYELPASSIQTTDFPLFSNASTFTDDTVMTIAVGLGILEEKDTELRQSAIRDWMVRLGRDYPNVGYGPRFKDWLVQGGPSPYHSYGNGSAMRVSAAAWAFDTLDEVLDCAFDTAVITHDHPEGIKGAQAVATAILMSRKGCRKAEIRRELKNRFGYILRRSISEYRETGGWNDTCQVCVPQAFTAFLEGESYTDVVRLAVSIGGDSDTLGAIAGSIAEAYYGVPYDVASEALDRLTPDLRSLYKIVKHGLLDRADRG